MKFTNPNSQPSLSKQKMIDRFRHSLKSGKKFLEFDKTTTKNHPLKRVLPIIVQGTEAQKGSGIK